MNMSLRRCVCAGLLLGPLWLCSAALASGSDSALIAAAATGDVIRVKALLAEGANVNVKDKDGMAPLHWTALHGHKEIVEMLLAQGADVNAKEYQNGWTPLTWAALNGHKAVVELLLANKADVNAKDKDGATALRPLAEFGGHKEIVEVLLAHGADANAKDKVGATPLHWAAAKGRKEIVEVLLPKDRSEWPPEVLLTERTSFPAVIDGKQVETAELPVGTKLRVIGLQGQQIKVAFRGKEQAIPTKATDLVERVMQNCMEKAAKQSRSPELRAAAEAELSQRKLRELQQTIDKVTKATDEAMVKQMRALEDAAKPQHAETESAETPSSILSQIKAKAQAQWPDDYEMQAYTIKKQTDAYRTLQSMTSISGVPSSVLDQIKSKAASQWPDDYEMQAYTIKKQTEAYLAVH